MQIYRYIPAWVFDILACMGVSEEIFLFAVFWDWEERERERERELFVILSGFPSFLGNQTGLWSRGCLGCFMKPSEIVVVDDPLKGPRIQGPVLNESIFPEDFWSSSTIEMENPGLYSQRSISNHALDPNCTSSTGTSNPHEFVNHGLLLWNHTRQQWLGNKVSQNKTPIREPRISWNATYESLLGTSKPFPRPIPLSEMVDFLVDIWEQEGLYD